MENIIVVLDDATHALNQVLPMRKEGVRTHWILLACPPRLTRHISRWVNQGSRNAWRKRWAQDLLEKVQPAMTELGDTCELRLLNGPLMGKIKTFTSFKPDLKPFTVTWITWKSANTFCLQVRKNIFLCLVFP